jgi:hypothetical protein
MIRDDHSRGDGRRAGIGSDARSVARVWEHRDRRGCRCFVDRGRRTSQQYWPSGLLVGGPISAVTGYVLRSHNDREVVDTQTGERLVINRSEHSFFFVPLHWAGLVIAVGGIVLALTDALN